MKIKIDNAYIGTFEEVEILQAYILQLDFIEDTVSNVEIWNKFFSSLKQGESVTVTIEQKE